MDALQRWGIFVVVAGGAVWYYFPKEKKAAQKAVNAVKESKKDSKKTKAPREKSHVERAVAEVSAIASDVSTSITNKVSRTGNGKPKGKTQPSPDVETTPAVQEQDEDDIDMSTRYFAEQLAKTQRGVDMKNSGNKESRVKTVKAKGNQVASGGSSEAGEDSWSPAGSPALDGTGVEDMLEPVASGPQSLRITAPTMPVKEKVNKPKKEQVVETKKQRQNRRKREAEKDANAESSKIQKAQEEQQRRTARIARGEPAKNGVSIPTAPVANPWAEQNAVRDVENPVIVSSGNQSQLLDTFDAESTSSSNAEASTAATSTTDNAPSNKDDLFSGEDEYQMAIEASEQESGWAPVKSKKGKNKQAQNGTATPVPSGVTASNIKTPAIKANGKSAGFAALSDEYQDPSNWEA